MSSIALSKTFKGIRFQLTLVYSTLFGLFICIFAFILTHQFSETTRQSFDSALLNYAIDIAGKIEIEKFNFKSAQSSSERELQKEFPFIADNSHFIVRSVGGKIIYESGEDKGQFDIPYSEELARKKRYSHRFLSLKRGKEKYRAINMKIKSDKGSDIIFQVATSSLLLDNQEKTIYFFNIVTLTLLIAIASLASYIIAGNALSPIKTLTEAANSIVIKNLSLRVPELNTGDEVEELSKTLNHLLERLQKSFEGQDHFIANAGHQLNTPLAIIKGELDVLESRPRSLEDHQKFFKSLREEIQRLIELVNKMLLVSRVEAGKESFVFKELRIDDLVTETASRLYPKAKDKSISLKLNIDESAMEHEPKIKGEAQLLQCLFENIIENAIKYSPENSTVRIELRVSEFIEVSISDSGPGMSEAELESILTTRFRRGGRRIMPGTGIGLSIAYTIAQHHNALIIYERLHPIGSHFLIQFPAFAIQQSYEKLQT
jgi:signal transduction histidine kinase